MKSLALATLSLVATAVMATGPLPDPQITINGFSAQFVNLGSTEVSNRAEAKNEAFQNLASNSGNVKINGASTQMVSGQHVSWVGNSAQDEGAYALQGLASNIGEVTINGVSTQLVTLAGAFVDNEAAGRNALAVQNLASNNACFKCEKPAAAPHY